MVSYYERRLAQVAEIFLFARPEAPWMPDDQDDEGWNALVKDFSKELDGAIWDRWCEWSAKHSVASAEAKLAAQRHANV